MVNERVSKRKNFVDILRRNRQERNLMNKDQKGGKVHAETLNKQVNSENMEDKYTEVKDHTSARVQNNSQESKQVDQDLEGVGVHKERSGKQDSSEKPKTRTLGSKDQKGANTLAAAKDKAKYKKIQDVTDSPEAYMLEAEQIEVCQSLEEDSTEDGDDKGVNELEDDAKTTKTRRTKKRKKNGREIIWNLKEHSDGSVHVEEINDSGDAAWLLGRDAESSMIFQCLLDSGNNSSRSVMSRGQYERLCKRKGRTIALLPYDRPIVAAGSTRLKIYGQLAEPLTIYFENFSTPAVVKPLVISSNAIHLNVSLMDIAAMEVEISFSKTNGNFLRKGTESLKLSGKRQVFQLANSSDPDFMVAYLNEMNHQIEQGREKIGEAELGEMNMVEKKLKDIKSDSKFLCKSSKGFSWCPAQEIVVGENFRDTRAGKYDEEWIKKGMEKVTAEGRQHRYIPDHTARARSKYCIPGGTFTYVPCITSFPLGSEFICQPACGLTHDISVLECLLRVSDYKKIVHIPVMNLSSESVLINKNDPIAFLQKVEAVNEEVKFAEKGKEEQHRSGPLSFFATATSTNGPTLVKDENWRAEKDFDPTTMAKHHPFFSREEIEEEERKQRKDYSHRPSRLKIEGAEEGEEEKEDRRKTKEILKDLENKPKFDGTWVEGELKPLDYYVAPKKLEPEKRKRKLADIDDEEMKEIFIKKLELEENDYLNELPEDVRKPMMKKILEVLVKNKLAFTAGEPDNDIVDEQGDCPWVEYQMEIKPEFRQTIFHEKPRPLSLSETEKLRQILVEWTGKGILRKNTPENASPHSLPVFLVSKKDIGRKEGAPGRLIFDARRLSAASVDRQIYLGSVSQTLSLLEKNDLYCSLDIGGFFSSIRLSATPAPGHIYSSQDYCSFHTTSLGSYSYLKCSQGINSSVNLAASIMQKILENIPITLAKGFSDDLLLSTKNEGEKISPDNWEHESAGGKMIVLLDQVLSKIRQGGLKLRLKKVQFMKKELRFLGYDISSTGVRVAWDVKKALLKEKPATSPKGLRQFLGKILFFKNHLPGYSCFTSRLHEATTRPSKGWALTKTELEDWFALRRLFLTSPAVGYPSYHTLEENPFRLFIDFSAGGLSCILTQFQEFQVENGKELKEVLLAVIAKKTNKALRNSSSFRGEASALALGLHHLGSMLRSHKWILFTDSLSLLYISGCKTIHNQLWRLYDQLTKQSFALVHLDTHSNYLCDQWSRLPDLEKLSDEEQQLFTEYIEQIDLGDGCENQELKKGSLNAASDEENFSIKKMQEKMLDYAEKLYHNKNMISSSQRQEGTFQGHGQQAYELPLFRSHVSQGSSHTSHFGIESLHCTDDCDHQLAWLPICNNTNERTCISRKNEHHCTNNWTIQYNEQLSVGSAGSSDEGDHSDGAGHSRRVLSGKKGEEVDDNDDVEENDEEGRRDRLHRPGRMRIPGSIDHPLSPEDIRLLQQKDPVLKYVLKFVHQGWPKVEQLRKQYFTPDIIKYHNIKTSLTLDNFGVLCRKRLPHEECMQLRLILPDVLKSKVFKTIHFSHLIHRGVQTTLSAIKHRYYYLGMAGDLRARILTCGQCYVSRLRSPVGNKYVPEKESIITQGLCSFNDLLQVDCSGTLVTCNCGEQHSSFVVFVDSATGFCAAMPLRSKKAENLKQAYKTAWVQHYNIAKTTKFDRGSEFYNQTVISFIEANGGSYVFTPTANARSNYTERKNLDIKRSLRAVLSTMSSQAYWCSILPEVIRSLNATISSSTGFSPQRLVFAQETAMPLDRLVGKPCYSDKIEPIREEDTSKLGEFKYSRAQELSRLADVENRNQLSETDKARARYIRFATLRENRLVALSRASESYTNNNNKLFPLKEADVGKAVYFYKSRIPLGKSKSLTQRWVGPNFIIKVLSPILAEVKTGYREICMDKSEHLFTTTIDNLYPFHPSHAYLADCDDPRLETLDEIQDNTLTDIEIPDEFSEFPFPCPFQQIKLTEQESVNFEKTWKEISLVDEMLLLSDIMPPGETGEGWKDRCSRAALEKYKQETEKYNKAKIEGQVSLKPNTQSGETVGKNTTIVEDSDDDDENSDEYFNTQGQEGDEAVEQEDGHVGGGGEEGSIRSRGESRVEPGLVAGPEERSEQDQRELTQVAGPEDLGTLGKGDKHRKGEPPPDHTGRLGISGKLEVEVPIVAEPIPPSSPCSVQPNLSRSVDALPADSPPSSTADSEVASGGRIALPAHIRSREGEIDQPRGPSFGVRSGANGAQHKDPGGGEMDNDPRRLGRESRKSEYSRSKVDWGSHMKQQRRIRKQVDPSIKTVNHPPSKQASSRLKLKALSAQLPGLSGGATSLLTKLSKLPARAGPSCNKEGAEQSDPPTK